ncbi:UDP-N-acetylglucosamine 1-carboxyvinyltransferase [Candidatus Peregrinibacteria bacterium CG10_big_fil_rev_8_21_14_0_10_49_16]|nr:MAG: UDP-N-acetylglucosamine 1-carboxyvinyltransferase [Candidatus Peregrinibacteria bacterium CG22_combo_CG10-13_8_21_14_all_49_11]PIR52284.1 MAG: UDP-N-acetylglucosamine 1-carboxyvinyltransferase [Candidatus Peregrinibacteria bacterium CG10_big_fil_rev_8_21_14_0_10_49_16]
MDMHYRILGGEPLRGDVTIGGSKNAALPLIAASMLYDGETVLHNVPRIRDTEVMLRILEFLGAETCFEPSGTVRISTKHLRSKPIPEELVSKLRASIIFLGPLLARFGVVEMAYPGGCVLGKRPLDANVSSLLQMGAEDMSTETTLHLQGTLQPSLVILPEFSVTATESVLLAAATLSGETRIELAAAEPHVQDLEQALMSTGVEIDGIGEHSVRVRGRKDVSSLTHTVTNDYLEVGTLLVATLVTKGKVRLHGVDDEHLLSFLDVVKRMGGVFRYDTVEKVLFVDGELSSLQAVNIKTNIHPGFPTDLQAPMGVAMSQAQGVSRIFERLYERKLSYLYELEKMGAHVEVLNAREALIIGPRPLRGRTVASNDIRAGAAMVLAALCAEGETTVTDVRYIERGYDRLDEKLVSLGARMERVIIGDDGKIRQQTAEKTVESVTGEMRNISPLVSTTYNL